ncbi:MAG: heparinase II/III family protein [Pseudomonadota bacterium]
MAPPRGKRRSQDDFATRFRVWRASAGIQPAEFARTPEPRSIGSAGIGRQICDGKLRVGGKQLRITDGPWDHGPMALPAEADRHGFMWLDDLAAVGTKRARELACTWLVQWLDRYATGRGAGWRPHVAGRRLVRWVHHGTMLLDGMTPVQSVRFRRSLAVHVAYLARHWRNAPPGLPTFAALCGVIEGGLALNAMERRVRPGIVALEKLCAEGIAEDGSIASRNPEDLLDLFELLVWCDMAMVDAGLVAQPGHRAAIMRIAPLLRALRQADGALARFHGGNRGVEGRLDSALAAARARGISKELLSMGYARLARGRATVILDGASPPTGPFAATAHASPLAFEMTVGRRPLVVNCGSGTTFGADWLKAARATPAHSALTPDGASAGQLKLARRNRIVLMAGADDVRVEPDPDRGPAALSAAHNAFGRTHGLIHVRRLDLGDDGAVLTGEDRLTSITEAERAQFDRILRQRGSKGIGFTIRFHLHPDVTSSINEDGLSVSLMLKSGELWQFQHASNARISLDPSVYLEKTRPKPTPTRQIVLEAAAQDYGTTIRWSFSRLQSDRGQTRDFYRDDMSIT